MVSKSDKLWESIGANGWEIWRDLKNFAWQSCQEGDLERPSGGQRMEYLNLRFWSESNYFHIFPSALPRV